MTARETFDVVVAGGGPGGSVTAARLAQKGRRVLVLERETFPRFHLGESLLPESLAVIEALGLLPEVDRRFIRKPGAQFHDAETGRTARFDFGEAFMPKFPYAYQVPRDEFDALLLENASAKGADVRHGWSVAKTRFDGPTAVGVEVTTPEGERRSIDARVVVDATGRDALLARAAHTTERLSGLDTTAIYAQWRGVYRDEGVRAGDFHLVVLSDAKGSDEAGAAREAHDPRGATGSLSPPLGWFWFIPFKDGRTSVGVAASRAWIRRHPGEDAPTLYTRAIAESAVARRFLRDAEPLWPARATADFSFRVRDLTGDGWLAVGDAGGFIDPLFSTGAHLAMYGGFHAADAIHEALDAHDVSRRRFLPWETRVRAGADLFKTMVESFYEGVLSRLLFADKPHPYVRRVITSLLAGNVFDTDSRWLEDARKRMDRPGLARLLTR